VGQPEQRAEGAGPFVTRLTWRLPDGGTAVWESRLARRRGVLSVRPSGTGPARHVRADGVSLARLRRLNAVAGVSFVVGGALFAAGAAVAQFGSGDATECASIYFVGGLFFTLGGYVSLLQAVNAPRHVAGGAGRLVTPRWRWWSYEPVRVDWLSAFVLFAGTLVFAVDLLDSFLQGLTVQQVNRLVWAPDVIGCVLFLISGHRPSPRSCTAGCACGSTVSGSGSWPSTNSGPSCSWPRRSPPTPVPQTRATETQPYPTVELTQEH
jgi:hypothetical protein